MVKTNTLTDKEALERTAPQAPRGGLSCAACLGISKTGEEVVLLRETPGIEPEGPDICFPTSELSLHGKTRITTKTPVLPADVKNKIEAGFQHSAKVDGGGEQEGAV